MLKTEVRILPIALLRALHGYTPPSRGRHAGLRTLSTKVRFLPVVPIETGTLPVLPRATRSLVRHRVRLGLSPASCGLLGRDLGSVWRPKPDSRVRFPGWPAKPRDTAATSGRACGSYPQRGGFESLRCNRLFFWRWEKSVSAVLRPLTRAVTRWLSVYLVRIQTTSPSVFWSRFCGCSSMVEQATPSHIPRPLRRADARWLPTINRHDVGSNPTTCTVRFGSSLGV